MAAPSLQSLTPEYERLFSNIVIRPNKVAAVDAILTTILAHKTVYEDIMHTTGIPWQVISAIHNLEASLNFKRHLHNGDPLTARTVHVPKGQPKTGQPPFTFAESAIDILTTKGLAGQTNWNVAPTLFRLEAYNGFGNRSQGINTPYLWSFSNQYTSGKFIADHVFSKTAVSKQCGAATLLQRMIEKGIFNFADVPAPLPVTFNGLAKPKVSAFLLKGNSWVAARDLEAVVFGFQVVGGVMSPLTLNVSYKPTAQAEKKVTDLPGRMFHGKGHVDASDLAQFLGGTVRLRQEPLGLELTV